jgi:membrane associated rhomboid family serine protease
VIIPTYLIIPTAIAAMILYMGLYYQRDPVNRVTDPCFLLGLLCVAVMIGQMVVIIQGYVGTVPSVGLFAAALALLIGAVWMIMDRRPAKSRRQG